MHKTDPSPSPHPPLRNAARGSGMLLQVKRGSGMRYGWCYLLSKLLRKNWKLTFPFWQSLIKTAASNQPLQHVLLPFIRKQDFYFCYENYLLSPGYRKQNLSVSRDFVCHLKQITLCCLNPHSDSLFQGHIAQPQPLSGTSRLPEAAFLSL